MLAVLFSIPYSELEQETASWDDAMTGARNDERRKNRYLEIGSPQIDLLQLSRAISIHPRTASSVRLLEGIFVC